MIYSTIAGLPTRGETYAKLMDHLREAQECAAMLAHLHNTEDSAADHLRAAGWLAVAEMFRRTQKHVTDLAMGGLQ